MQLDKVLDSIEQKVGCWNPANKFVTLIDMLENLCDKVDMLDQEKSIDAISKNAKQLNSELDILHQKLYQLQEIDYDKQKIDFLYKMCETALE